MVADYFRNIPIFTARMLLGSWLVALVVFMTMPWYAGPVNDYAAFSDNYGGLGPSCTLSVYTPGLKCLNLKNITELALAANRTTVCDCMQGIFGETLCPIKVPFTVSGFIASAPANGLIWGVSIVPLMSMLWHCEWVEIMYEPHPIVREILFWTLIVGIISYNMLAVYPYCTFKPTHMIWIVGVLTPTIAVHWLLTAWLIRAKGGPMRHWFTIIAFLLVLCFNSLGRELSGHILCADCNVCCTWGYWVFETSTLVLVLGMPTFMVWIAGIPLPMPKDMKERLENAHQMQ